MKLLVINGPNLNMLGIREPDIYGRKTYADLVEFCQKGAEVLGCEVDFYQSNHEGDLVDAIQKAYFDKIDGIVFNPAAYTHTSIAIPDAIRAVGILTVEVHLSDLSLRENYRQVNYIRDCCAASFEGMGIDGYYAALDYLIGPAHEG